MIEHLASRPAIDLAVIAGGLALFAAWTVWLRLRHPRHLTRPTLSLIHI